MNDDITVQLLTKLIELKTELDTADKKLTFRVTAPNYLVVGTYPYFDGGMGIICRVNLNKVTKETYSFVVNSIRTEFAAG